MHDSRNKANLLLEQFKSVFTQEDVAVKTLHLTHKPPDVVNRYRYQSSMNIDYRYRSIEIDNEKSYDFD